MTNHRFPKLYSYLGNNQFMSLAGNLAASGLGIISVSLLFRALPIREIGVWVFFITVVGLADSFRAGFLTTALIRACSGATPDRAREVTGSAWAIALGITGALGLLSLSAWLAVGRTADAETALLLRWFGVVLVATLPYFMASCVLQAEMRFDRILYIRLLSQGLFVLSIGVMMLTGTASLEKVVYCYVGASVVTSVMVLVLGWARLGSLSRRSGACIRELAEFGKYSVGSYVGSTMLRSSDSFVIKFMLGPAPLAVYNLAGRFMEIIEIPLRSFVATAMPALSAAYNQNRLGEVAHLLRKNAGMLTWAFVPATLGAWLLADLLIYVIGGAKYGDTEAANLLRMGMALAIIYPIDRFVGVTLDVLNQPRLNLYKVLLMLVVNVVGDVTALTIWPNIYGVALASLPTGIAGFTFGYLHLRRHLPLSLKSIMATGWDEGRALLARFLGKLVPAAASSKPR
ncbi:oligosaccharide flippase family protein [uncultured Hymenobacter sp.]|uniref:oligosaccharide flippase family protein n=1 Tax=uncultured Hymenobacter sp. TaxID=170016 RepID=UPI0035CBA35E